MRQLSLEVASGASARSDLKDIAMPGYTHMQRAMPTTVTTWLGSFASGFADAAKLLAGAEGVLDQNPLGSAAGFGINGLVLDRAETAERMGFAKVQENVMCRAPSFFYAFDAVSSGFRACLGVFAGILEDFRLSSLGCLAESLKHRSSKRQPGTAG